MLYMKPAKSARICIWTNKVLVLTGPNTYDIAAKHAIESLENQDIEVDVKIVEKYHMIQ